MPYPSPMSETIQSDAQPPGQPTLTDPLEPAQVMSELPAISVEDSSSIKLVTEVERDYLTGEKYLELVILQRLLQVSSCTDRRAELLVSTAAGYKVQPD